MSTTNLQNQVLTPGQRIIHLMHGDGKVTGFDEGTNMVSAEFPQSDYGRAWRRLVPLAGYLNVELVTSTSRVSNGPTRVQVPLAVILDETSYAWSIPSPVADHAAELKAMTKRIKKDPITVDLDTWQSIKLPEHFNKTLIELTYVDRTHAAELIDLIVNHVDHVTVRYLRSVCGKRGRDRDRDFAYARKRMGKDFWATQVYGTASLRIRQELDRLLMSLVLIATPADSDDDIMRVAAERLAKAVESRIEQKFSEEFKTRSTTPPGSLKVDRKSDAIAASA